MARSIRSSGLPHPIRVDLARTAIAAGTVDSLPIAADAYRRTLLTPVVNATGVLLHTNLGRAPRPVEATATGAARALNLELDLATGERGSRQHGIGRLLARLCGAEAAIVVNNNAAAVLLVLAALAAGRDVPVSRGESVEIGGSFRVPDVMAQSGARLVDVGTTNRTRCADYQRALDDPAHDVALILKVHPSNYRVEGFVEDTPVRQLATLDAPVVVDLGSGLIDASCPWLDGPPPAWLAGEPAAVQTLADGAALVTFSGDKLLGGPQAGIIAGRADLVERCQRHPLARALRPGALVLTELQRVVTCFLDRRVVGHVPFWTMAATPLDALHQRAQAIVDDVVGYTGLDARVVATTALAGAGSTPGSTIESVGVDVAGDRLAALRRHDPAVIARSVGGRTVLDVRSVDPADDAVLIAALISTVS